MAQRVLKFSGSNLRAKSIWLILTSMVIWSATAVPAFSCACCTEVGDRRAAQVSVDDYLMSMLRSLKFGDEAITYTNACGLDCVAGIEEPQPSYQLEADTSGEVWKMVFSSSEGVNGEVSFAIPDEVFEFFVDRTPGTFVNGGPLYKEIRMNVRPSGTGTFAAGLADQPEAEFILHGEGNHCTSSEDFTNWQLRVKSESARYVLFGVLVQSE